MAKVSRVGDSTSGTCDIGETCCPHGRSGTNTEGTSSLMAEGIKVHLKGQSGSCNCPHGGTFESTEGTSNLMVEGIPVTLVGHSTKCKNCGKSGSHTIGTDVLQVHG